MQTHHFGGQHYQLNTFPLSIPLAFPVKQTSLFRMCVCPPDSKIKYFVLYVYLYSCIILTYFPGIFYAVVRQISMLFIDNKDSILFCVHAPVDGTGIQCLCSQGPVLLPPALPWPGRLPRSCPEHCQTEASLQCYQECCRPQHPHHQHF